MPGDSSSRPDLRHQQDEPALQGSPGLSSLVADIGDLLFSTIRIARALTSATGRSVVWTRLRYRAALHQSATTTIEDRYPALFDAIAARRPKSLLSFGCSSGEELLALRRRLPAAHIVGVELNPRARRLARQRTADDSRIEVVERLPLGPFDAVLALAVLQREPHRVIEEGIADLTCLYPFPRFDAALTELVERLRAGGTLALHHAHYRAEDSSVAPLLTAVDGPPQQLPPLFDRSSRRYDPPVEAASLFIKADDRCAATTATSPSS